MVVLHKITEKGIDGEAFLDLTREDLDILFPKNFLLGKKLYKYISLLDAHRPASLSPFPDGSPPRSSRSLTETPPSSTPSSQANSSASSTQLLSQDTPTSSRKRLGGPSHSFALPKFDASLERALSEDAIYDSQYPCEADKKIVRAFRGILP